MPHSSVIQQILFTEPTDVNVKSIVAFLCVVWLGNTYLWRILEELTGRAKKNYTNL